LVGLWGRAFNGLRPVVNHQVLGRNEVRDRVPLRCSPIGLLPPTPNDGNIQQGPISLLFPGIALFQQLPTHVSGDALSPLVSQPLRVRANDPSSYDIPAIYDCWVSSSVKLEGCDGDERECNITASRPREGLILLNLHGKVHGSLSSP